MGARTPFQLVGRTIAGARIAVLLATALAAAPANATNSSAGGDVSGAGIGPASQNNSSFFDAGGPCIGLDSPRAVRKECQFCELDADCAVSGQACYAGFAEGGQSKGCVCYVFYGFGTGEYGADATACQAMSNAVTGWTVVAMMLFVSVLLGTMLFRSVWLVVLLVKIRALDLKTAKGQSLVLLTVCGVLGIIWCVGMMNTALSPGSSDTFERQVKGPLLGVMLAMFMVSILNVSVMWLEVVAQSRAMRKRKGGGGLGKVNIVLRSIGSAFGVIVLTTLVLGKTNFATMIVMFADVIIAIAYGVGGARFARLLSSIQKTNSGDKHVQIVMKCRRKIVTGSTIFIFSSAGFVVPNSTDENMASVRAVSLGFMISSLIGFGLEANLEYLQYIERKKIRRSRRNSVSDGSSAASESAIGSSKGYGSSSGQE